MTPEEKKKWTNANLVLGGSWYPADPHPELGNGASFQKIGLTMNLLREKLIARDVTIEDLPDILQSDVPSLAMKFHEFLRYDKSPKLLGEVLDEVLSPPNETEPTSPQL